MKRPSLRRSHRVQLSSVARKMLLDIAGLRAMMKRNY